MYFRNNYSLRAYKQDLALSEKRALTNFAYAFASLTVSSALLRFFALSEHIQGGPKQMITHFKKILMISDRKRRQRRVYLIFIDESYGLIRICCFPCVKLLTRRRFPENACQGGFIFRFDPNFHHFTAHAVH